jgi:hypothetical protein
MEVLLGYVDKANGAVYAALERPQDMPLPPAFVYGAAHRAADEDVLADLVERYVAEVQERAPAVHPQLQQEAVQQEQEEVQQQQQQEEEVQQLQQKVQQQQQQQQQDPLAPELKGQEGRHEGGSRDTGRLAAPAAAVSAAKEPG